MLILSLNLRFDILVNGGGSVTLQFQRIPFQATTRTVFVPWNEIVVLDPPILMWVGGSNKAPQPREAEEKKEPCAQHDLANFTPVVMSSWLPGMVGGSAGRSVVFGETQVLLSCIQQFVLIFLNLMLSYYNYYELEMVHVCLRRSCSKASLSQAPRSIWYTRAVSLRGT